MNIQKTCGCMAAADDYGCRFVRPLDVDAGWTDEGNGASVGSALAIDVKTIGGGPETGAIIRLNLRQFEYDHAGAVTWIGEQYEWFEDPGCPVPREVTASTGISDDMLMGQAIEDWVVTDMLQEASVVIAHGVGTVRPWIERRLEGARDLYWACSMFEVDWYARGFDGVLLRYLLMQAGYQHDRDRPGAAVDAIVQMLRHRDGTGRTVLSEMLAHVCRPS